LSLREENSKPISKIFTPGKNFLAGGAKDESVFVLSDIRPANITERRTRIDQPHITEILESCQVLLLFPLRRE
jgi:hypothetical protein